MAMYSPKVYPVATLRVDELFALVTAVSVTDDPLAEDSLVRFDRRTGEIMFFFN